MTPERQKLSPRKMVLLTSPEASMPNAIPRISFSHFGLYAVDLATMMGMA